MKQSDAEDLTARLVSLREVLERETVALQVQLAARMDGMDRARNQYLDQIHERSNLLQEEIDRRLQSNQDQLDRRMADAKESADRRLADLRAMLDERYATQTKALDAAFLAQQTAMRTAFDAADKAVAAALESAEKAVAKAEVAAEKRFESVNEFRAQLTDQAATFLPRIEYETNHQAITEKLETGLSVITNRLSDDSRAAEVQRNALELRLSSRLDLMAGRDLGDAASGLAHRENINTKLVGLTVVISVIVVIVNVLVAALTHHL